jgi:AraC-like DNA-binding protein
MVNIRIDPSRERTILDFRPLGFRDAMVLGRYHYCQVHHPLQAHNHGDMYEICLLDQGRQVYVVGDESYVLKGGDAFFTRPHEVHGTGCNPEDRGTLYWLLLRVPRKSEPFLLMPPAQHQTFFDELCRLPSRVFPTHGRLKPILDQLIQAFSERTDPLHVSNLQNLVLRFMLDFIDIGRRSPSEGSNRILSCACKRAQEYVLENLEQRIKVEALAKVAGLSPSRFKARFKREMGMAPIDYVLRCKIDNAKLALSTTGSSVTEVAFALGFSSSQHFATVFRRFTGLSPRSFRQST